MYSKKDLEKDLDKIPPSYPYEIVADLREAHRLFETDKKSPQVIQVARTIEELVEFVSTQEEPPRGKALRLLNNVDSKVEFGRNGNLVVYEVASKILADNIVK